jgi:hypothetical protein
VDVAGHVPHEIVAGCAAASEPWRVSPKAMAKTHDKIRIAFIVHSFVIRFEQWTSCKRARKIRVPTVDLEIPCSWAIAS